MYPELFGVAWAVAAVFALLVALPVLRDVAVEGIEHHRQMRARGDEPLDPDSDDGASSESTGVDAEAPIVSPSPENAECRHCGAANDSTYRYCRRCGERL